MSPPLVNHGGGWGVSFGDNTETVLDPFGFGDDTGSNCFVGVGEFTTSTVNNPWGTAFGYTCFFIGNPGI
jgi:hypothetical protein